MSTENQGPSLLKLGLILYPFTITTVAVNLFMVTLAWQAIGLPALSPTMSLLVSLPISLPINWLAAKWVRRLIDEAED